MFSRRRVQQMALEQATSLLRETQERLAVAEGENARLGELVERLEGWGYERVRAETDSLQQQVAALQAQIAVRQDELTKLRSDLVATTDLLLLQELGLYDYAHPLEDAATHKERLAQLTSMIKSAVRDGHAVTGTTEWTVNGSASEGRRMVAQTSKLMLRAYNAEAENCVRTVKPHRRDSVIERLNKTRQTIARLGKTMSINITEEYHQLRVREVLLTADYLAKVEEEREAARAERERAREEREVQAQLAREERRLQEKLEKERAHYQNLVAALGEDGDDEVLAKAQSTIAEIEAAIDDVETRAANLRTGYVYVISNVGSFGEGVVKIGLTRRLDPLDRIRELGSASVPFGFDIHLMLFSSDAVGIETALHQHFASRKVNLVNGRKEFFSVSPREVLEALNELDVAVVTFHEEAEALQWRQSEALRAEASGGTGRPT
jgi:hypothetical protein